MMGGAPSALLDAQTARGQPGGAGAEKGAPLEPLELFWPVTALQNVRVSVTALPNLMPRQDLVPVALDFTPRSPHAQLGPYVLAGRPRQSHPTSRPCARHGQARYGRHHVTSRRGVLRGRLRVV